MLTPSELARMLHVSPKTVTRWAREGKLHAVVTPGGHHRFPRAAVRAFLREMGFDEQAADDAIASARRPVRSIWA